MTDQRPTEERPAGERVQRWAQRVLAESQDRTGGERRRNRRRLLRSSVCLTPLEPDTLWPRSAERFEVSGKDLSPSGLGVVAGLLAPGDLFVAEVAHPLQRLLVRLVRERRVSDNVREYGFAILDRFDAESDDPLPA